MSDNGTILAARRSLTIRRTTIRGNHDRFFYIKGHWDLTHWKGSEYVPSRRGCGSLLSFWLAFSSSALCRPTLSLSSSTATAAAADFDVGFFGANKYIVTKLVSLGGCRGWLLPSVWSAVFFAGQAGCSFLPFPLSSSAALASRLKQSGSGKQQYKGIQGSSSSSSNSCCCEATATTAVYSHRLYESSRKGDENYRPRHDDDEEELVACNPSRHEGVQKRDG